MNKEIKEISREQRIKKLTQELQTIKFAKNDDDR
jgi:hypothetical protein